MFVKSDSTATCCVVTKFRTKIVNDNTLLTVIHTHVGELCQRTGFSTLSHLFVNIIVKLLMQSNVLDYEV